MKTITPKDFLNNYKCSFGSRYLSGMCLQQSELENILNEYSKQFKSKSSPPIDVEKLAEEEFGKMTPSDDAISQCLHDGFIKGFTKSQELNAGKEYTEDETN